MSNGFPLERFLEATREETSVFSGHFMFSLIAVKKRRDPCIGSRRLRKKMLKLSDRKSMNGLVCVGISRS